MSADSRLVPPTAEPSRSAAPALPTFSEPPLAEVSAAVGTLADQGKLAFVAQGRLFLLDSTGLSMLDDGRGVSQHQRVTPRWSPSGDWLAFQSGRNFSLTEGRTTQPALPGRQTHVHPWPCEESFAWSPTADLLAISLDGLWLVQPGAGQRKLRDGCVASFVWSPDGGSIAYVDPGSPGPQMVQRLYVQPLQGEAAEVPLALDSRPGLVSLAAWWPASRELLFWFNGSFSKSIEMDGLPLFAIPLSGGTPRLLAHTPVYRDWICPAPDGRSLALVESAGRHGLGRDARSDKAVKVCPPNSPCQVIATPVDKITAEPAWSPDGHRLALLEAVDDETLQVDFGDAGMASWNRTHSILLADPSGHVLKRLEPGAGALYLRWSADARKLLFVRDDWIWLLDLYDSSEFKVAGPLRAPGEPAPYGWIRWAEMIAWAGPR